MKKHLFYCFLYLNLSAMSAQINTLTIQGTVVDSLTQSGVPYVNIGFPAHSIGTSTNELGVFIIKIPQERLEDTLTFSSIGYATVKLAVNDLNKEKKISVALKATDISLAEFTVKALDANKLLKSFFKNLDKNYATEPALMQLFCRETTKKGDENLYFAQSEGIVEMYKSLGNKITNFDDSFWEEYNFIKSVDTLQENTITTSDTATLTPPKKSVNVSENIDNQSNSEVNFIKEDFKTAKKMAAAQRKFIFVDVYTTWCGPCKKMAAGAFHDEEVSALMNTFLINVKVTEVYRYKVPPMHCRIRSYSERRKKDPSV